MSEKTKNLIDFSLDAEKPLSEEESHILETRPNITDLVKNIVIGITECSAEEAESVNFEVSNRDGSFLILANAPDGKKIAITSLSGEDFTISTAKVLENTEGELDLFLGKFNALIAEMGNEIN
jgi:hypothetical protein